MISDDRPAAPAPPALRSRTTDSPMEVPSARRAFLLLGRLVRLRCPHCGRGRVLRRWFWMHERCASCNFRFERSDEHYFQGAMFVNFMLGGAGFAASFLAVLLWSWPEVPWNTLTFGGPVALVVFMVFLYPISKLVWLTADVMLRPVTQKELD